MPGVTSLIARSSPDTQRSSHSTTANTRPRKRKKNFSSEVNLRGLLRGYHKIPPPTKQLCTSSAESTVTTLITTLSTSKIKSKKSKGGFAASRSIPGNKGTDLRMLIRGREKEKKAKSKPASPQLSKTSQTGTSKAAGMKPTSSSKAAPNKVTQQRRRKKQEPKRGGACAAMAQMAFRGLRDGRERPGIKPKTQKQQRNIQSRKPKPNTPSSNVGNRPSSANNDIDNETNCHDDGTIRSSKGSCNDSNNTKLTKTKIIHKGRPLQMRLKSQVSAFETIQDTEQIRNKHANSISNDPASCSSQQKIASESQRLNLFLNRAGIALRKPGPSKPRQSQKGKGNITKETPPKSAQLTHQQRRKP